MIVVTGDVHLKKYLWPRFPQIVGDTERALTYIVNYAEENGAEAILFAGDIFDPPNSYTIDTFNRILKGFSGKVFGIDGNPRHDRAEPAWFSVDAVRGQYFHKKVVAIDGLTFYGLRNMSRDQVQREVTKIPAGVDFLIGHQLVKAIPRMYKSWNLDENWIPHHVWGVILGDYHRPIEFRLPNGNLGYYTGTTTPQKVNEIDYDRGFIVIEGGKVKREQIPGRDFFKLPVTAPEELDALKICPGEDITPVVVLEYDVETKGVHEAIRAYRQKNADKLIVIAKPMKEADEVTSGELPVAVEMRDVISDITSNPQVIEFVSTLLTNCNREILVGFRDRFGEMNIREEEQRV